MKADLTYRAVTRQLQGMRADSYEIGVLDPIKDHMLQRTFPAPQVVKSLSWLKSMNSQGRHVYIRPKGSQGLVLVDDLTQGALDTMKADDFAPAVIVETSPLNFQAWVRLSETPLDEKLATACARLLAQRYEGDPASADWRHYGRLAGFTNRKPAYVGARGRYPFVKLHVYNGKRALQASQLLCEAQNALSAGQQPGLLHHPSQGKISASQIPFRSAASRNALSDPIGFYQRQLKTLQARYGHKYDESRGDWMIAVSMAKNGFPRAAIEEALEQVSPDLTERKGNHTDYYIAHTLDKVMQLPEVLAVHEALTHHQKT